MSICTDIHPVICRLIHGPSPMNESWWHQNDRVCFIEDHAVVIEHAAATGRTASGVAQTVDAHFTAKLTRVVEHVEAAPERPADLRELVREEC